MFPGLEYKHGFTDDFAARWRVSYHHYDYDGSRVYDDGGTAMKASDSLNPETIQTYEAVLEQKLNKEFFRVDLEAGDSFFIIYLSRFLRLEGKSRFKIERIAS